MTETIKINTSTGHIIHYSQQCMCCNNTRRLPDEMTYCTTPWVCDDCKDAIEFLKFLKTYDQDLVRLIMESKK